jgi:hypothetical protein
MKNADPLAKDIAGRLGSFYTRRREIRTEIHGR